MGVSGVSSNTFGAYAKRIGRIYLHSTFGTGADEFMSSMNSSIFGKCPPKKHWYSNPYKGADWSNLGTKFKDAFKAVEAHEETLRNAHGGSWFKTFWHQIKTIPEVFSSECKAGYNSAKAAGKFAFGGGVKGFGNALMKRMPLICGLLAVLTQIPNVFNAFTDQNGGIGTGVVELGKAAGKLGLETAGFMVGQALIPIPFVGGIIGSIAAGIVGEKILGKSFSEKQAEANGGAAAVPGWVPFVAQNSGGNGQQVPMQGWTPPAPTMTDEQLMQMAQYLNRGGGLNYNS